MKLAVLLCFVFAGLGAFSNAQEIPLGFGLRFGMHQGDIAKQYGRPFGPFRVSESDYSSQVGVTKGLWQAYHLTVQDRMYVTIFHFDANGKLDSLMLEPNGLWSARQVLNDQPELREVCASICDVSRVEGASGGSSILLRPRAARPEDMVAVLDGDSGRPVADLQSVVSWVYALSEKDFVAHHRDGKRSQIGTWPSER